MQAAWQQLVGLTIEGRYRLMAFIDAGSFGGVYQADEIVGGTVLRRVALKVLRPPDALPDGGAPSPEQRDALIDKQLVELQWASQLEHPQLVRTITVGITELAAPVPAGLGGELLYVVMELGESTLAEELEAGPLALEETLALARQLAGALDYLHDECMELNQGRGFIHGDVKPANILRIKGLRGHRWKLGDLGAVRILGAPDATRAAQLGTVEYAPPEAFQGQASPAWDTWSLGVVLCDALTGKLPFGLPEGETSAEAMAQSIVRDTPRLPACPAPLLAAITGCLVKDPARRLTAQQVLTLLDGAAAPAAPATVQHQPTPRLAPPPVPSSAPKPAPPAPTPPPPPRPDPLSPVDTHAEQQLRLAVQRALEDDVLTPYERGELNELRKRLDIRLERAASIFREESARRGQADVEAPPAKAPAASAPPLDAQPALAPPDASSFKSAGGAPPPPAPTPARELRTPQPDLVVDQHGKDPSTCRTIGEALSKARAGERIKIRPGHYREHLVLDKPVELIGDGQRGQVIIESSLRHTVVGNCDGIALRRLHLRASGSATGATTEAAVSALVVSRGRLEAEDCIFECTSENCIAAFGATALPVLRRCQVSGARSVGLSASHDARVLAEECTFQGNGLAGASCSNGGHLRLLRCHVQSGRTYGVLVYVDGIAALRECDVTANASDGVALKNGGRATIERCRISVNSGAGVMVQSGCTATVEGCDLGGNARGALSVQRGASVTRINNRE